MSRKRQNPVKNEFNEKQIDELRLDLIKSIEILLNDEKSIIKMNLSNDVAILKQAIPMIINNDVKNKIHDYYMCVKISESFAIECCKDEKLTDYEVYLATIKFFALMKFIKSIDNSMKCIEVKK